MDKKSEKLSDENLKIVAGGEAKRIQTHRECPQCGQYLIVYTTEVSDKLIYTCANCGFTKPWAEMPHEY